MRSTEPSLTLGVDMRNVAVARGFVKKAFAGVVPTSIASDLMLVTSELVTNAMEHGDASAVVVSAATGDGRAWVSVRSAHDAGRIASTEHWQPAAPDRPSGRGLGIVHALADEVSIIRRASTVEIIVSKRLET